MSFIPATAECTEGVVFSLTVTPVNATSIISVTPSIPTNIHSNVNYVINGGSFSVVGTYNDMFERSISYIDTNRNSVTVNRWGEIPENFNALYRFKAPTTEFVDQVLTVKYRKPDIVIPTNLIDVTENFILTIRHNWQSDVAMVKNLAISGKYYKDAKLAGKAP